MREIQIDLTLWLKMPESGLNVNGVLMGLGNANARISFAYFGVLFSAIEEQTIEQMHDKHPGRYVHNGYQTKERELRTSLGPFQYRLAQLYDKVERKTVVPFRAEGSLSILDGRWDRGKASRL